MSSEDWESADYGIPRDDLDGDLYEGEYDRELSSGNEGDSVGENEEKNDFSEGDAVDRDFAEEEEEINFGETFSDKQRTAGGAINISSMGGYTAKAGRSAEQAALEKARGILEGENMYTGVKDHEKTKILTLISHVERVERCSIEILVLALLFKVRSLNLKKDFASFYKMFNPKELNIQAADLVRYIRQYSNLK